jgi:hypothetical protein
MKILTDLQDRDDIEHAVKCKCGCRFMFKRGEARFTRTPARILSINCPECHKENSVCLDDEKPNRGGKAVF